MTRRSWHTFSLSAVFVLSDLLAGAGHEPSAYAAAMGPDLTGGAEVLRDAGTTERALQQAKGPAERLKLLNQLFQCYREAAELDRTVEVRTRAWGAAQMLTDQFPGALETFQANLQAARLNARLLDSSQPEEDNASLYEQAASALGDLLGRVKKRLAEEEGKTPPDRRVVDPLRALVGETTYEVPAIKYAFAVTLDVGAPDRESLLTEAAEEFARLAFEYRDTDTAVACSVARAVCLKTKGDLVKADEVLSRILGSQVARHVPALRAQASYHHIGILLTGRQISEAEAAVAAFHREFPGDARSNLGRALALEQARAYLTEARILLGSDPRSREIGIWLGKAVRTARQIDPLDPNYGRAAVDIIFEANAPASRAPAPGGFTPTAEEKFIKAQSLFSSEEFQGAADLYRDSLTSVEKSLSRETAAKAFLEFAIALHRTEQFQEARSVLERIDVPAVDPEVRPNLKLLQAEVYQRLLEAGHDPALSQRRRDLLEEVKEAPHESAAVRARLLLAEEAVRGKRYEDALALLSGLTQDSEEKGLVSVLEAQCYWGLYQQALTSGADTSRAGQLLDAARKRLESVLGEGGSPLTELQARAAVALAAVYNTDLVANFEATTALVEKVLGVGEVVPEVRRAALVAKVQALQKLGRFPEAATVVGALTEEFPQDPVLSAVALPLAGEWVRTESAGASAPRGEDIVKLVNAALGARDHMDARSYLRAGWVLTSAGEHARAAHVLEEGLGRVRTSDADGAERLRSASAKAYVDAGQLDEAARVLGGTDPVSWPASVAFSWALSEEQLGHYSRAAEAFRRLAAISNRNFDRWVDARYHLALNLHRLGRSEEALEVLVVTGKLYSDLAREDQLAALAELERQLQLRLRLDNR